jgi:hypothetical protein
MIIGVTATRHGMVAPQWLSVVNALLHLQPEEVHEGDCVGGDDEFFKIVRMLLPKTRIVTHPPVDNTFRAFHQGDVVLEPKTHFARNRDIVSAVDIMFGVPLEMTRQDNGGTWYTIDYALKVKKPIHIIWRNGSDSFHFPHITDGAP